MMEITHDEQATQEEMESVALDAIRVAMRTSEDRFLFALAIFDAMERGGFEWHANSDCVIEAITEGLYREV